MIAVFGIILALATACASTEHKAMPDIANAPAGDTFSQQSGDYVFAPNDVVEVYVHRQPKYSGKFTVGQSGYIVVPHLGPVYAKKRSVGLLQNAIQIKLRPFVKYPRVTVSTAYSHSYRVVFSGSVRKPGVYTFSSKTTLLEGIAIAGGVLDQKGSVTLIREDQTGVKKRYSTSYNSLSVGSPTIDNFVLERGDIVFVN